MDLVEVQRSYSRENYRSYEEHADRSLQDLLRQEDAGWIEGPLHYWPRIVNAQAGILKGDKYRPVMDARRSGLNAAIRPSDCSYYMLSDLLQVLERGDRHGAFDFKDAFYMWPRENRFCDYQGLQGPKGSPGVYRMRFMTMGTTDSPGIQQGWARIVKKVVNEKVLRPLGEQHVLESGLELEPLEVPGLTCGPSVVDARREQRGDEGVVVTVDGTELPGTLSRGAEAVPPEQPTERRLVGGGSGLELEPPEVQGTACSPSVVDARRDRRGG